VLLFGSSMQISEGTTLSVIYKFSVTDRPLSWYKITTYETNDFDTKNRILQEVYAEHIPSRFHFLFFLRNLYTFCTLQESFVTPRKILRMINILPSVL
jgi:hypothetical protein